MLEGKLGRRPHLRVVMRRKLSGMVSTSAWIDRLESLPVGSCRPTVPRWAGQDRGDSKVWVEVRAGKGHRES